MPDEETSDKLSGQGDDTPGSPDSDAVVLPGEAGQDADGAWSKKQQALWTHKSQELRSDYDQRLELERQSVRAEMEGRLRDLRAEMTPPEEQLPEGVDPNVFGQVLRQTPEYREMQKQNATLRKQVREQAISSELVSVRNHPRFDKVRDQVDTFLRSAQDVAAGAGEWAYRYYSQPLVEAESEQHGEELNKLREEKRVQLEQANAESSGGQAAGGGVGFTSMQEVYDVGKAAMEKMEGMPNDDLKATMDG